MPVDVRWMIAAPLLGALAVAVAPTRWARAIGGAAAGLTALAGLAAVMTGAGEVATPWVGDIGLQLAFGLDGLATPGVLMICLVGQVAALARGGGRGTVAGGLMLQGTLLALVLARDLAVLVGCHALLAPLVAGLVACGDRPDRLRAGQAAGLYLAVGTGALAVAVGLLAVAHHDASGGFWDLSLAGLAQVLAPRGLEAAIAGAIALAGALTLGLWPLHGWLVAAGAAAPGGAALMIAGPVRWVGAYVLMRLWVPLAPEAVASAGLGVAALAVVGAVVGPLCARAEPDARRALLLASATPTGLVVIGLVGLNHEGVVGAQVLALVVALGGAAGLAALTAGAGRRLAGAGLLPAPGLAGCVGAALVLIGSARFGGAALGGHGWLVAVAAGIGLAAGIGALSDRTGGEEQGDSDRSPETGGWWGWLTAAVLAAPLVALGAWPGPWLARLDAVGRAVNEAAALRRCLGYELAVPTPTWAPAEPIDACAQPLRALERRAVLAAAQAEREAR